MNYILGAFIGYLLLMLGIGVACSGKMDSLTDYYLGGRKLNKWVVAMSAQASDMSGWLLMGLPGAVFLSGFGDDAWIGVGLVVGTYLNWLLVAKRLRVMSQKVGAITIPDFISNRFGDRKGIARMIAAAVILVFFTFYTASGFVAAGKLFSSVFGLPYIWALWIGGFAVVSYTFLGGFLAVSWTDFIQGMLMLIAIVIIPAFIIKDAGGVSEAFRIASETATSAKGITAIGFISAMAWGLGYFGMPHVLVRFMSINDAEQIRHSRRIATIWVVIALAASVVGIGILGHTFVQQYGIDVASADFDAERIFILMIMKIFDGGPLSLLFAGLLLSAIMAAIMSTADSQLLVSASAFTNDFYKKLIKRNASEKELVLVSRFAVAAVALIAVTLASDTSSSFFKVVMKMVSFAWAGFGAAFGPLILLALFWRRTNLAGAVSGMVVGATTCFVWKFVLSDYAANCPVFGLYELFPGFILALVTIVVVSLVTKEPPKEVVDQFDAARAN